MHHHDAVGEVRDDPHVVGDEEDGRPELVTATAQQVEDLGLHGDVERGRRLVGDDEPGVEGERHRDHDALLLAARELVRVVVHADLGLGDADAPQHVDGRGASLRAAEPPVRTQALLDLPADRVHRVEDGGRLLEDHRDVGAARLPEAGVVEARDVVGAFAIA